MKNQVEAIQKKIKRLYEHIAYYNFGLGFILRRIKKNNKLLHYNIPGFNKDIIEYLIGRKKYEWLIEIFDYQTKFKKLYLQKLFSNANYKDEFYDKLIHKILNFQDIGTRDKSNRTAIFYIQDKRSLELLLKYGPDLNIKDCNGDNFLQFYIKEGVYIDIDGLNLSFNYNSTNNSGENAMATAMKMMDLDWILRLIDNKNISIVMDRTSSNWLNYLTRSKLTNRSKKKIISRLYEEMLLQDNFLLLLYYHFSNINKMDEISFYINTLILISKKFNSNKIIKLLTNKDRYGNTIVHYLAKEREKKLLMYILNSFDIVYDKNIYEKTPYHIYCENKISNLLKNKSKLDKVILLE